MIRRKEGTVTISILKEEIEDWVIFSGFISLTSGFRYLPPFLPNFKVVRPKRVYDNLCKAYNELVQSILLEHNRDLRGLESEFKALGTSIMDVLAGENGPLGFVMKKELADIPNVIIFTNESLIPWHLAFYSSSEYDDRESIKRFLQIGKKTGTIFVQKLGDESTLPKIIKVMERTGSNIYRSAEDGLKDKNFLFIRGKYRTEPKLNEIIDKEIEEITDIISSKYEVNIKIVDNWHDTKDYLFEENFVNDLELIYYSGHMDVRNNKLHMILSEEETIPSNKISDIKIKYESEPLIFLNSCYSGNINDILNKEASFSTAFLNNYASGCIVVTGPAEARISRDFATSFFQRLFEDPANVTYGEALRHARLKLNNALPTLLFHLYGDPGAVLIYVESEEVALLEAGLV